jgi:hypothetical protein
MANITIFVNTQKEVNTFLMELKIWIDDRMEIIHIILIFTIGSKLRAVLLIKRRRPRQDF